MDEQVTITKSHKLYIITFVALILGVVFDYLFFRKYIGISVVIFVVLIAVFTLLLAAWHKVVAKQSFWLFGVALFFSAMVAVRANLFLTVLNILAATGSLLLVAHVLTKERLLDFTIRKYLSTVFVTPFLMIWKSLCTLSSLVTPTKLNPAVKWKPVVKGIMMALPLLVIFIALFSAADVAFKNFLTSIFKWHIPADVFSHTGIIVGLFIICLGFFSFIFVVLPGKKSEWNTEKENEADKDKPDRRIETQVFLWLINALFLVFIIFQIAYLFGGAINIGEFTYAEYARRGFWELLMVTGITLLTLLIMDFYTRNGEKRKYWFTFPSLVMTTEIFIIVASALKRMMLYQSAYGWTTLRLYVAGFIIFLVAIFLVLILKLILEKKNNFFAFGTLLAMIVFLVVFNFINPDGFIVRQNIERFNKTGKIDAEYLGNMSADATTDVLSVFDRLTDDEKTDLQNKLYEKKVLLEKQTKQWPSYNYARVRSLHYLSEFLSDKRFLDKAWKYPIMTEISAALKKYNDVSFLSYKDDYLRWLKNKYALFLRTSDSLHIDYCGLPTSIGSGKTKEFYDMTPLGKISQEVVIIFNKNGYIPNKDNVTNLGDSDYTQSFEKDGTVCSFAILGDAVSCNNYANNSVTMDIKCASGVDQAYAEQKPFLDLLNFRNTYTTAYELKRSGDFVLIGSTATIGGADYILKNNKGKYTVLEGPWQEQWYCDRMDRLNIPKELYEECYDPSTQQIRK